MRYSGRLRLLTLLEKKVFRTSAVSLSELITSPSSINVIFALDGDFSERNGLTVLQNFLLSVILNSLFMLFFCFRLIFDINKHSLALFCSLLP